MKLKERNHVESNLTIYNDRFRNMSYIEIAYPYGSKEIDNIISLLKKNGYILESFRDRKIIVDNKKDGE